MGSGDPMLQQKFRSSAKLRASALAGAAVAALLVAGCGAREPVQAPPSAEQAGPGAPTTPELAGAAPVESSPADGLLGGPTAEPVPVASQPLPPSNPNLKTWRRADGTLVTAMAPIANPVSKPRVQHRAERYAPRAETTHRRHADVASAQPRPSPVATAKAAPVIKPAAKPVTVAAAPAPLKPVAVAKPAAPLAKPPTPVVAAAAPAKPLTKVQQLQAAVAPAATKGAVLASGESLSKGQPGQVTLSLPASLGDLIKKEAAKLGLGKAAKKTSAYADLQGDGYEITPNGRQTAVVKPGEQPTFAWNVKPTPQAKGALKTEFGVEMNGAKPAQSFSLGSIAKQVAPIQEKAKETAKRFALPFGLDKAKDVDVPGLGKVPAKSLLGGALVLLALILLVIIARSAAASRARAERRRKFRTHTDYGRNEMELDEPKPASVNYVNPMVAAAGGALVGAAVSHAHDDHAHAPPAEHEPFAAPHDDSHGHHDQGHDDHHVAPLPGAEALHVSGVDHASSGHGHDDHSHDDEALAHVPDTHGAPHGHGDHGHDDHAPHKELEHAH
ncbi:MAG: hypothetical protein J7521_12005 [Caulobacter sp.]|nr:hypothetical protein [Caulobacter sp.]